MPRPRPDASQPWPASPALCPHVEEPQAGPLAHREEHRDVWLRWACATSVSDRSTRLEGADHEGPVFSAGHGLARARGSVAGRQQLAASAGSSRSSRGRAGRWSRATRGSRQPKTSVSRWSPSPGSRARTSTRRRIKSPTTRRLGYWPRGGGSLYFLSEASSGAPRSSTFRIAFLTAHLTLRSFADPRSVPSLRRAPVVPQQAAQVLVAANLVSRGLPECSRLDELVVEPLVRPLPMIVLDELGDGSPQ